MNMSLRNGFPALLALLVLALPVRAAALSKSEVVNNLMCYRCPEEHLANCQCGGAQEMKDTVQRFIGEGKTEPEILDYFVARYGKAIVSTPPRRGFALTAYVAPYIGLLAGVIVALFLILRWARPGRRDTATESGAATGDGTPPIDAADRERVAQELARLEREE
jgi:cytochrome c-type biogenesis protein CcmH